MTACERPACQSSISPPFGDPRLYPPAHWPGQRPAQNTNPLLSSRNNRLSRSPSSCEANTKTPHLHGSVLEEEQERNRNMIRSLILLNQYFSWHIYRSSKQLPYSHFVSNFFLNQEAEDLITDHSQRSLCIFLETIRHHHP